MDSVILVASCNYLNPKFLKYFQRQGLKKQQQLYLLHGSSLSFHLRLETVAPKNKSVQYL